MENSVTTVPTKTQSYTPKYNSQANEPSNINGIGNNKVYSSWRVGK